MTTRKEVVQMTLARKFQMPVYCTCVAASKWRHLSLVGVFNLPALKQKLLVGAMTKRIFRLGEEWGSERKRNFFRLESQI